MKQIVKLTVAVAVLGWLLTHAPTVAATVHEQAQTLANTQQACAKHTAAVNEVLNSLK